MYYMWKQLFSFIFFEIYDWEPKNDLIDQKLQKNSLSGCNVNKYLKKIFKKQ